MTDACPRPKGRAELRVGLAPLLIFAIGKSSCDDDVAWPTDVAAGISLTRTTADNAATLASHAPAATGGASLLRRAEAAGAAVLTAGHCRPVLDAPMSDATRAHLGQAVDISWGWMEARLAA